MPEKDEICDAGLAALSFSVADYTASGAGPADRAISNTQVCTFVGPDGLYMTVGASYWADPADRSTLQMRIGRRSTYSDGAVSTTTACRVGARPAACQDMDDGTLRQVAVFDAAGVEFQMAGEGMPRDQMLREFDAVLSAIDLGPAPIVEPPTVDDPVAGATDPPAEDNGTGDRTPDTPLSWNSPLPMSDAPDECRLDGKSVLCIEWSISGATTASGVTPMTPNSVGLTTPDFETCWTDGWQPDDRTGSLVLGFSISGMFDGDSKVFMGLTMPWELRPTAEVADGWTPTASTEIGGAETHYDTGDGTFGTLSYGSGGGGSFTVTGLRGQGESAAGTTLDISARWECYQ